MIPLTQQQKQGAALGAGATTALGGAGYLGYRYGKRKQDNINEKPEASQEKSVPKAPLKPEVSKPVVATPKAPLKPKAPLQPEVSKPVVATPKEPLKKPEVSAVPKKSQEIETEQPKKPLSLRDIIKNKRNEYENLQSKVKGLEAAKEKADLTQDQINHLRLAAGDEETWLGKLIPGFTQFANECSLYEVVSTAIISKILKES